MPNRDSFIRMFRDTMANGRTVVPRGSEIREIEDLTLFLSSEDPFMGFKARDYDVNYFRAEMLWKLGANRFDESIKQHAKMWTSVQNDDGSFNSNYGQFWFGDQQGFFSAYQELVRDKDSRRAYIPMLSKEHMGPSVRDTVCTLGVGFRIREERLNMSVYMRSSDQVFGLGTDIPTFFFLYRLMIACLTTHYPYLKPGLVNITAMSSHIYSRHYDMVNSILVEPPSEYKQIIMPWCQDAHEAMAIVAGRGKHEKGLGPLADWLLRTDYDVVPYDDEIPF